MKKVFKVLSAVFSLVIIMSAITPAFASEDIIIEDVYLSVDTHIAGLCANDYKKYFTIETDHVVYSSTPEFEPLWLDDHKLYEKVDEGDSLVIYVHVSAEKGYKFADSPNVYLNGKETSYVNRRAEDSSFINVLEVYDKYTVKPYIPQEKVIKEVSMTLDKGIAGKKVRDFYNYAHINTPHVSFANVPEAAPLKVFDYLSETYLKEDDELVNLKDYAFRFYLAADEGYGLSESLKVLFNGNTGVNLKYFTCNKGSAKGHEAVYADALHFTVYEAVRIKNYKDITVDFKSTVILNAQTYNNEEKIAWYDDNGKKLGDGNTLKMETMQNSVSVHASKVDKNGNEIKETSSATEKITVKNGFFDKFIAFFRGLFGSLPVWEDNNKR